MSDATAPAKQSSKTQIILAAAAVLGFIFWSVIVAIIQQTSLGTYLPGIVLLTIPVGMTWLTHRLLRQAIANR